jgi:hypothetical protein
LKPRYSKDGGVFVLKVIMYCPNCEKLIGDNANYCPLCGYKISSQVQDPSAGDRDKKLKDIPTNEIKQIKILALLVSIFILLIILDVIKIFRDSEQSLSTNDTTIQSSITNSSETSSESTDKNDIQVEKRDFSFRGIKQEA